MHAILLHIHSQNNNISSFKRHYISLCYYVPRIPCHAMPRHTIRIQLKIPSILTYDIDVSEEGVLSLGKKRNE